MRFVVIIIGIIIAVATVACETEEAQLVATVVPTSTSLPTTTTSGTIPTNTPLIASSQSPSSTLEPTTVTASQFPVDTPSPIPTSEPTATPAPQSFNIGDTVRLGGLELTVNGVRASFGNDFWEPDEGSYFLYIDVAFRNTGDEPTVVSSLLQMELQDAKGFQYSVDFTAIAANDKAAPEGEIAPGGFVRGEIGYQIPIDATGLIWKFSGDVFRLGEATYTIGAVAIPTPTPVPPGYSLENAVSLGETLLGSDGTEIRVLGIIPDARQLVAEENSFNDPPAEGNRFIMIWIDVTNPPSSDPIRVSDSDFSLIGDNRVVYTTFQQSCGVIPDELRGEIFGGGQVQGKVCFEIPKDEGGLFLIHEPGFRAESRRFLRLSN